MSCLKMNVNVLKAFGRLDLVKLYMKHTAPRKILYFYDFKFC